MKLRIEKAIYGGDGLARIPADSPLDAAGKTVFVPYALPGELVEARIVEERRSFATAELDKVLEPSPERVRPGCEYFPACGGCQYQHASTLYQPLMKLAILRDTLERAHISSHLPPIGILEAEAWGYRNRIRLQIGANGGFALCYRERGTHSNLSVTHCPIAAPLVERAIAAMLEIGLESSLAKLCDEVEFFVNGEQDALLVSLWSGQAAFPANGLRDFSERLRSQVPEFTGAGLFSSGERGRLLSHWGQRSLLYSVAGHSYQVSLGSFFQVNRFLIPGLLDLVTADGQGGHRRGGTAWDLYAGAGLFSRALDFEDVTAVEASPFSAADLEHNLAASSHRAVRSATLDFIRAERRRSFPRGKPDFILLDPPRAGLGKEVCAELAQIAAPEVVYVSCDPATLARDLQALLRSGYCLRTMHMVDLFPQTFHLETVTALTRG